MTSNGTTVTKESPQAMEDELIRAEEVTDQVRVVECQSSSLSHAGSIVQVVENERENHGSSKPGTEVLINETTQLLSQGQTSGFTYVVSDPKGWVIDRTKNVAVSLAGPLLSRLSDAERNAENYNYKRNWAMGLFLELFILFINAAKTFLRNIQEHSLAIAPIVSVGHMSTEALAASAVASLFANITGYSIIRGLASTLDGFLTEPVNKQFARTQCQRAALISSMALPLILLLWYQADVVFVYLKLEPEVMKLANLFLKVTAIGLPAFMINEIMKRYLSSQGLLSVQTTALTAVAPLNMVMNYLLVHGPASLNLGFIGAPLSMTISYIAVAVLTLLYVSLSRVNREMEVDTPSCRSFLHDIRALFFGGLAGIGRSASEYWSKEFGTGAASLLGANALAAQAVLLATASTAYQFPRSLASACVSRVKMQLGQGDTPKAVFTSLTGLMSTIVVVIMLSNASLAFAHSWIGIFTSDPQVVNNVTVALPFVSMYIILHGFSAWLDAMLGAIGRTAVFPTLCASFDYSIGIPTGAWLAFVHGWGLSGLWAGLTLATAVTTISSCNILVWTVWNLFSLPSPTSDFLIQCDERPEQV